MRRDISLRHGPKLPIALAPGHPCRNSSTSTTIGEMSDMEIDEITGTIVDIATKAHRRFGPTLLESFYEAVLTSGLRRRGLRVERQRLITVSFDDLEEEGAFRADLLV